MRSSRSCSIREVVSHLMPWQALFNGMAILFKRWLELYQQNKTDNFAGSYLLQFFLSFSISANKNQHIQTHSTSLSYIIIIQSRFAQVYPEIPFQTHSKAIPKPVALDQVHDISAVLQRRGLLFREGAVLIKTNSR